MSGADGATDVWCCADSGENRDMRQDTAVKSTLLLFHRLNLFCFPDPGGLAPDFECFTKCRFCGVSSVFANYHVVLCVELR